MRRVILLFVIIFFFSANSRILAVTAASSEPMSKTLVPNITIVSLGESQTKVDLEFDTKELKSEFQIVEANFLATQQGDNTEESFIKFIDSSNGSIINVVSATNSDDKRISGFESSIVKRSNQSSYKLTLQLDSADTKKIITLSNISIEVKYNLKDVNAPKLLSFEVAQIDSDSALIVWETNEKASSKIRYGKTSNYSFNQGSQSEEEIILEGSEEIRYKYTTLLLNLSSGVTYHYQIVLEDTEKNLFESPNYTFTTQLNSQEVLGVESQGDRLSKIDGFFGKLLFEDNRYKFSLFWEMQSDNIIEGYLIYRQSGEGELEQIAQVQNQTTTFIDVAVEEGQKYSYFVRSFGSSFVSPKSDQLSITVSSDNVFQSDSNILEKYDLRQIIVFVFASTIGILIFGYILVEKIGKSFRSIFLMDKRKNQFRDPDFFMKEFEK